MVADRDWLPPSEQLQTVERVAVEIARAGGEETVRALQRAVAVSYKADSAGRENHGDPVSEVDHAVEALVRERVLARFPNHQILGEEGDGHPDADADWLWVVDPVDGTANFINGFPLYAVSIGVLYRGCPVAAAVWCGTTHALHPGVYHAHAGGALHLDGAEVTPAPRTVKRGLAAAPGGSPPGTRDWDHRVTGSMAIEAALVAAGTFAGASFGAPKLWDVAGGVLLVQAAGREVWIREGGAWQPFVRFVPPSSAPRGQRRAPSLRDWHASLVVGTAAATAVMRSGLRTPGPLARVARRVAHGHRARR